MKQFVRILIAVLALAGVINWTFFTVQVWQWGHSFNGFGVGDGAGTNNGSPGAAVFGFFLIGVIWLLPASPYLCIAAGSMNLVAKKISRAVFVYSLIALSIITLIMIVSFQWRLELIAFGNFVTAMMWIFSFRGTANEHGKPKNAG
jgi:hypothetical protein